MTSKTLECEQSHARVGAALAGTLLGVAATAFVCGTLTKTYIQNGRAQRLAAAAEAGFASSAIQYQSGLTRADNSAVRIADRYAPAHEALADAEADAQADNRLGGYVLRGFKAEAPKLEQAVMLRTAPALSDHPIIKAVIKPFQMAGASARDLQCLTTAVYYEARGDGQAGMAAVAQVVLNRTRHPDYPKYICQVVFQGAQARTGCQFSFTCNGAMSRPVERNAWKRAEDVARQVLNGQLAMSIGSATHFHALSVSPPWSGTYQRVAVIGGHAFYRQGSAMSAARALNGTPIPSTEAPILAGFSGRGTPLAAMLTLEPEKDTAAGAQSSAIEQAVAHVSRPTDEADKDTRTKTKGDVGL